MKISVEQENWISSLKCCRLKDYEDAGNKLLEFENERNQYIVDEFFNRGKDRDDRCEEAYYVIIDSENNVLFFFSIKCGLLEDMVWTAEFREMVSAYNEAKLTPDIKSRVLEYQLENSFSNKELKENLMALYERLRVIKKIERSGDEPNVKISKNTRIVQETYPAIEVSCLCKNQNLSVFSPENFNKHRLGEIVFWRFIVDKIKEIRLMIGAKFIYLFAADDNKEQETLVAYYTNKLGFKEDSQIMVSQPRYNAGCRFLYADCAYILEEQEKFFIEFNRHEKS